MRSISTVLLLCGLLLLVNCQKSLQNEYEHRVVEVITPERPIDDNQNEIQEPQAFSQEEKQYGGDSINSAGQENKEKRQSDIPASAGTASDYKQSRKSNSRHQDREYPGFTDSSQKHYGGYQSPKGTSNPQEHFDNESLDQFWQFIITVAIIINVLCYALAAYCIFKCMKKRSASKRLMEQMRVRKAEFASSIGMNAFEMNNRLPATVHI